MANDLVVVKETKRVWPYLVGVAVVVMQVMVLTGNSFNITNGISEARLSVAMAILTEEQVNKIDKAFTDVERLEAELAESQAQATMYKAKFEKASSIKEAALNLTVRPAVNVADKIAEEVKYYWNNYEFQPSKLRHLVSDEK